MAQVFEYPPILQGNERQQIAALRAYLVRLAEELYTAQSAPLVQSGTAAEQRRLYTGAGTSGAGTPGAAGIAGAGASGAAELRETAQSLRSLIIKTADRAESYTDSRIASLRGEYMAQSDFGAYSEELHSRMEATAREVIESYDMAAVSRSIDGVTRYVRELRGQIQRGIITDPDSGEAVFGIAIAESLGFTGETRERQGETYYELTPGQTLGLYTASGWQFWINGVKKGWFDSTDGMLHVSNVAVENSMLTGDDWLVTTQGGYGIRYIGGV